MSNTCRLFGINRQVYYRALKAEKSKREIALIVIRLVKNVRLTMPRIGTRKLYHLLRNELKELNVRRDKFFQIMRANNLLIKPSKQYHVTTNSHHRFRKHKNLIATISINKPEQVWVSDITYIGTRQDPMYLSLVTDAYSKKIMGFNVSTSLNASGAIEALKQAIRSRSYTTELIHHSDRGLQYCCDAYQDVLSQGKIRCSMTESYDPYQNAIAERVNGILKQEFIQGIRTNDLELMTKLIEQSIRIYNEERPH